MIGVDTNLLAKLCNEPIKNTDGIPQCTDTGGEAQPKLSLIGIRTPVFLGQWLNLLNGVLEIARPRFRSISVSPAPATAAVLAESPLTASQRWASTQVRQVRA